MADTADAMQKDTILILQNHWQSRREGNLPPFRSEISPREIPDTLDTLFIFEHIALQDIRVRIAGLKLCEMIGVELRGRAPETMFNAENAAQVSEILSAVMDGPEVGHLELEATDAGGNREQIEMVLLPLRSDFGDVNRIIGCISEPRHPSFTPARFEIRSVTLAPMTRGQSRRAPQVAEHRRRTPAAPFLCSENRCLSKPVTQRPTTNSYLSLVR